MTGSLYSLSRKEGSRRYVEAPARSALSSCSPVWLKRLSERQRREDYNDRRHDWHANFGILRTPQLTAVHDELDLIVAGHRQDGDRVRRRQLIDALPGLGKTTIASLTAAAYDRQQGRRLGAVTAEGNERVPVFRVGLTSNTTLRTLNRMICEFYGHPGTDRAAPPLASHALDCVLSCDTRRDHR